MKPLQENRLTTLANQVYDLKDQTERKLDSKFAKLDEAVTEIKDTTKEIKGTFSDTSKRLDKVEVGFENLSDEVVDILKEIKTTGLKGDPGNDANEEAMEERLLAKIPTIEELVKDIPTKDEIVKEVIKQIPQSKPSLKVIQESIDIDQVVEKVEEKLNKKPLEIHKVNGLQGKLDNMLRDIARGGYHGGGDTVAAGTNITITTNSNGNKVISSTGGTGGTPYAETPSGTVDGSNTVFTLAHTPDDSASVKVFLDGIAQYNGVDYSVSGTTITFVAAPASGSTIFAYYNDNSAGTSSGITLQTNGVANGSQTLLNLAEGTGITLTDNGSGTVTIDSTGGVETWTAATAYSANQLVTFGTRLLRRTTAGTSNGAFTNGEAADWTLISNPVATVWAPSNYEYQGELFTVGTRTVVRTAADGVTGLAFDAAESGNYEVVEKLLLASFQPNTLYYTNEKFTGNGVMYRRFNTGMSGATFDATEQQEWRVDGNDNLPIGATSQTRTAASVTVGFTDGELILAPAGATMNVALNATMPDGKLFGFNGTVDSTKIITWSAGVGTTIEDPISHLPVASFDNSLWTDTAEFSFQVIKANNVWRLRGI